jgi:putative transposase
LRAKYAKEILAMDESMTLKHFYAAHADDITRLVVEDEGALVDIDDRASYERELRKQSDDTRPTPRTDSTQAVVGRVAPRGAGKLRRNADDMPHQKTQSTTTGASTQAVVGRVPPRGAGARTKSPRRLRRLNTTWAGDGFPCFFLTICVEGRAQVLADGKTHSRLLEFLLTSPQRYGWWPSRYVIMPDHLHLLVRRGEPPRGATRPTTLGEWVKALKAVVGTREVKWQKGFFDHLLRTEESEAEKWEYIRQNPVRAGLVAHAEDWAFAGEINEKAKEPPRGGTRPTT